jgi:hypothetical protein
VDVAAFLCSVAYGQDAVCSDCEKVRHWHILWLFVKANLKFL